jgi:hypothetical protein
LWLWRGGAAAQDGGNRRNQRNTYGSQARVWCVQGVHGVSLERDVQVRYCAAKMAVLTEFVNAIG